MSARRTRLTTGLAIVLGAVLLGGSPATAGGSGRGDGSSGDGGGAGNDPIAVALRHAVPSATVDGKNCAWTVITDVVVTDHGSRPETIDYVAVAVDWSDGHHGGSPSVGPKVTKDAGLRSGAFLAVGDTTFTGVTTTFTVPCKATRLSFGVTVTTRKGNGGTASVSLLDGPALPSLSGGVALGLLGSGAVGLLVLGRRPRCRPAQA
jgi:hypothetical protein